MVVDPRPLCTFCVEEKVEKPELGFMYSDLDGNGRKPVCYGHYNKARQEIVKKLLVAEGKIDGFQQ